MARSEREEVVSRLSARVAELEGKPLSGTGRTELKLRKAMLRLLNGAPLQTDGALTNENLHREAGVPRPTMYRYREVMEDWKAAQGAVAPESPAAMRERIRSLKAGLRRLGEEHAEERRRLLRVQDVLVQRVQALTLALVEARDGSKVVDIDLLRRSRKLRDREAEVGASEAADDTARTNTKR